MRYTDIINKFCEMYPESAKKVVYYEPSHNEPYTIIIVTENPHFKWKFRYKNDNNFYLDIL